MQVYYLRHNITSKMKYSGHLDINAYMPLDLHGGGDFKTCIIYRNVLFSVRKNPSHTVEIRF